MANPGSKYVRMLTGNNMAALNNGTIPGGLAYALQMGLQGHMMGEDRRAEQEALAKQQEQEAAYAEAVAGYFGGGQEGPSLGGMLASGETASAPQQYASAGGADTAGPLSSQLAQMARIAPDNAIDLWRLQQEMGQGTEGAYQPGELITKEVNGKKVTFEFGADGQWHEKWASPVRTAQTSVNVSTGNKGPQFGTIPQGYMLQEVAPGQYQMVPVEGGPAAREISEQEQQDAARQNQASTYADVVTTDIDRATDLIKGASIPVTGMGSVMAPIPGTTARDVGALIDTIKANVGFDRLQQMRAASPTGGALGQVSEFENRLLQATIGNLEQSQSQEQVLFNLARVKDIYGRIIHEGIQPGQEVPQGGGAPVSEMSDDDLKRSLGIQ